MQDQVLDFCGIKSWLAIQSLLPLQGDKIYLNAKCIAILPIITTDHLNGALPLIKKLFYKMLMVLNLKIHELTSFTIDLQVEDLQKDLKCTKLTNKLLALRPSSILIFGAENLLVQSLLVDHKIAVFHTLHPRSLLQHPEHKIIAYKDLLACQKHLSQIL